MLGPERGSGTLRLQIGDRVHRLGVGESCRRLPRCTDKSGRTYGIVLPPNGMISWRRFWPGQDYLGEPETHRTLRSTELDRLASDDLIEIGAHTVNHPRLAALPPERSSARSRTDGRHLRPPSPGRDTFAYPHGGPDDVGPHHPRPGPRRGVRERLSSPPRGAWGPATTPSGCPACSWRTWTAPDLLVSYGATPGSRWIEQMTDLGRSGSAEGAGRVPKVSVITIFRQCTSGILRGSYRQCPGPDGEQPGLLFVDDGSTDDSPSVARRAVATHPERMRLLTHPNRSHRGMSASRNLGYGRHGVSLSLFSTPTTCTCRRSSNARSRCSRPNLRPDGLRSDAALVELDG